MTCFAARFHPDVTEEKLADLLHGQGILSAKCCKLSAKDSRVFQTSAFRVSCSSRYESLFYDEAEWPEGVELRDWVFFTAIMADNSSGIASYNIYAWHKQWSLGFVGSM